METIKQLAQRIEREVVDAKHIEKEVQKWRALLFNTTHNETPTRRLRNTMGVCDRTDGIEQGEERT